MKNKNTSFKLEQIYLKIGPPEVNGRTNKLLLQVWYPKQQSDMHVQQADYAKQQ